KFGKYLAARQLELPEYSGFFINYKALKKLINVLIKNNNNNINTATIDQSLQDKKGSFFFRLERELEKVNNFYLEKEAELKFKLDILIEKKNKALKNGNLNKNSISFASLYDSFKKFSKDLDRLEQFVELNETGFTKVLKKWDKRSKSRTKELYLSTAINVQPVFHRDEIIELSDLVANNLMDLEAIVEGANFIRYEKSDTNTLNNINNSPYLNQQDSDELYTDFYELTTQDANISKIDQANHLQDWSTQVLSKLSDDNKKFTLSKVFMLLIPNLQITDDSLHLFYNIFKDYIDLNFVDDLNGRTCLHEASCCKTGRNSILKLCLEYNLDIIAKDISGKTCLHYITEQGRDDLLLIVLQNISKVVYEDIHILDLMDNESISPLLMAIIHNHVKSVEILLNHGANGFPLQDDLKPKYLPLNVACKKGNIEIVKLLLKTYSTPKEAQSKKLLTKSFQSNAEGLLPLHIVASSGHDDLIPLLLEYGADINQFDKLNKWSPIFYSVIKGYESTTKKLIENGADFNLKDEDGFNPLYYAIWEGNVEVLNALNEAMKLKENNTTQDNTTTNNTTTITSPLPPSAPQLSFKLNSMSPLGADFNNTVDMIPDLSLPPPIIPLRKYGHNFLEKKIFLKLSFYTNRNSIKLHSDTFLTSIPGRLTISCDKNDLIPRNLLLPVLDNDKSITFQTDSFDDFAIDFELFPTFGTRLIAKSTLSSTMFQNSYPGVGCKLNGDLEIPLFDVRLRNIGFLKFNYEIVYPYSGIPLEISMYDTYWKSSTAEPAVKSISFVTASSLSGEYYRVHVFQLSDGTPCVCPYWKLLINGVELSISSFDFNQIKKILYDDDDNDDKFNNLCNELKSLQPNNNKNFSKTFESLLSRLYIPLSNFLELIPIEISLNIEIFYPSIYELEYLNLKYYTISSNNLFNKCQELNLNPTTDNILNNFIDLILSNVFTHVRSLRSLNSINPKNRSLILSSDNSSVCTILNWKQPNYPVFYNMNGIKHSQLNNRFISCSSNGFPLNDSKLKTNNINSDLNINNIDSINKDSTEYLNDLQFQDKLTRSIKLSVIFATVNNLLGLIVPNTILKICPELIKSIRLKGLILVASTDDINYDYDISKKSLIDDVIDDIDINGLRFSDILSFKDTIDM
ncbi:hypothetical protein CANARDRAFT_204317, partial [[Candida] arabinofermentans NRRL YB-2248]